MIERDPKREPYTTVKNRILYTGGLTLEELGLYTVMLSRPNNWEFNVFVLARECSLPSDRIGSILQSLAAKGYARERKGRFGKVWDLFESPAERKPPEDVLQVIAETARAASIPKPKAQKPAQPEPDAPERESGAGDRPLSTDPVDVFLEKARNRGHTTQEEFGQMMKDYAAVLRARNGKMRSGDLQ